MKWKNRGHEIDQYAQEILQNPYMNKKKYYIFGAGLLGRDLLAVLRLYEIEVTFIDNNTDLNQKKINKANVISLEKYLSLKDGCIVIAATKKNTEAIARQLEEHLLQQRVDFWLYDEFVNNIFPIVSTYFYNKSYIPLAQITLTERCSLKCKKCAHGCFAVDNKYSQDLTLKQVYKSADSFFSKVDFIKEFVLIGGEPLLYKEISEAILYIGEHYRNQMGTFSITTTGTIVPEEKLLKVCRKYDVLVRISNYVRQLPRLKDSHQRLKNALEMYGVPYVLGKEEREWMDYGFGSINREVEQDELIKVFDACRTPCREIRENRFYYCVMARSVSDNLRFNIGEDDYLDLDKLNGDEYKKELLEFNLGYSDKGYLEMCRHCRGAEAENFLIPAAEQI